MIFVVNDLTWFEQKKITMLHQKYVQRGDSTQLVVAHNMRTTKSIHEAESIFKKQISDCYDGDYYHSGNLIFTSTFADHPGSPPPIHHIGFANEHSPAGKAFNANNRHFLVDLIVKLNLELPRINLMALMQERFSILLPKFMTLEAEQAHPPTVAFEEFEMEDGMSVTEDEGEQHDCVKVGELMVRYEGVMGVRQRGVVDENGEINGYSKDFKPKPNIYDVKEEQKDGQQVLIRHIEVECPGVRLVDIATFVIANGVRIEMRKDELIDEAKVVPYKPIQSTHGHWKQDFQFDVSEGRFEYEGVCEYEDGIFIAKLLNKPPQSVKVPVEPQRRTRPAASAAVIDTEPLGSGEA
jgi:hypothetical protein